MTAFKRTIFLTVILVAGLTVVPSAAWPAALVWDGGSGSNSFMDPVNWNPNNTPDTGDTCTINDPTAGQPLVDVNSECGSLTLGTGASVITLTFDSTRNLTITGDVTIGANGRITPIGTTTGVFTIGGNWSDDLATTNITSANFHNSIVFNGTGKTISTNETRFYDVQISGTITLNSDFTIANSLTIQNTFSLTHGANTLTLNGNTFAINGTYNFTCASTLVINGTINMTSSDHYPNTVINSGGSILSGNPSYIDCDMTLQTGGTLTVNGGLEVGGDWIRNGGTFSTTGTVTMTGAGKQIRGTTSTTFYNLTIGNGAGDSTTVMLNTTVNNNLTVTAGAAMTMDAGKNMTVGLNANINGTTNLSGTTTWTMSGGGSITVAAGGLISAQGTDSANRVTFTRSGASYYDLSVNGGIDFNYVNIYYTRTATTAAGFSINSPVAATTNFNNVALNFTEDGNKAVMMVWNSNKTITATGCTFDSATYTPPPDSQADFNVQADIGTINFTSYGGNYAGEALDNDNGGNANWIASVVKRAFTTTGTAIPDASTVAVGTQIKFMLYINNTGGALTDVSIQDALPANFLYQSGTIKAITEAACAVPVCTPAEESTMYTNANGSASCVGSGSPCTDGVDADTVSFAGTTLNVGNQFVANAQQNVGATSRLVVLITVQVQ